MCGPCPSGVALEPRIRLTVFGVAANLHSQAMDCRTCLVACAVLVSTFLASFGSDAATAEFFEMRIRPLLAENCYACHTSARKGGLEADSGEGLRRGGNSGPALLPGNSAGSLLIQAVSQTHERLSMPPQGKLADNQIEDLKAWIDAGASWPETQEDLLPAAETASHVVPPEQRAFWSFQPLQESSPPEVRNSSWPRSPIDHFILAKLEQEGLEPVPAAGKRTLIRRASFDLIGLPPSPQEVEAFLADDDSPEAFARVVDRLLSSPHYGERWGRHWLDLARYSDGRIGAREDTPYPNAHRYRDWVVKAFNQDLPYDRFIKAQLAADLLPSEEQEELLAGLGFLVLAPSQDDLVDVTARSFMALTVGCARCHDHKYDPIPTQDFYSLKGVFASSEAWEYPLVEEQIVEVYKKAQEKVTDKKDSIQKFIKSQSAELTDILLEQTSSYMVVAWKVIRGHRPSAQAAAEEAQLDSEVLDRWIKYLDQTEKEYPYLQDWEEMMGRGGSLEEARDLADRFQEIALNINREKKELEDRNYVKLGGAKGAADMGTRQYANLEFLDLQKWYLWRDLAAEPHPRGSFRFEGGVTYYGSEEGLEIDRFLTGQWKRHLDLRREELKKLEEAVPEPYPFLQGYRDLEKPKDLRIAIRGDEDNPGKVAPRRFLHVLSEGVPESFSQGSGRLELAKAIASPENPLTARVMVNRVWQHHFGQGIIRTPSNLGRLGAKASHPGLLDYLAARFIRSGWSIKALHREIMLSATYALSSQQREENAEKDPDNRLLWRANLIQRLDAEALRDTILAVSGQLDRTLGGPSVPLDDGLHRRTLYAVVSRTKPDPTLAMFDFPDPNTHSAMRGITVGPMQRLYFLNSNFVMDQAAALAERLKQEAPDGTERRIERAYALLYGRPPTAAEVQLGLDYVQKGEEAWPEYAQVLLASSEFSSVP